MSKFQAKPSREYRALLPMNEEVDQSTNLPEASSLDFQHARYMLKEPGHFENWLRQVTEYLNSQHLDGLLDIRIPRPELRSPAARKWQRLSIQVREWLSFQMTLQLYLRVQNRGYRIQLADEFIMNARIAFQDSVMGNVAMQVNPLLLGRRTDFRTPLEYAQAVWEHYVKSKHLQMYLNPCVVLSCVFTELRPEIPEFIDYRTALLDANGDVWNNLVIDDVEDACVSIIDHLKALENVAAQYSRPSNDMVRNSCHREGMEQRKRKRQAKVTPVKSETLNALVVKTERETERETKRKTKRETKCEPEHEPGRVDWVAKIGALFEGHKPPTRAG